MQLITDKTLNCPGCIIPISEQQYAEHIKTCAHDVMDIMQNRLQKFSNLRIRDADATLLIEEYLQFVLHDKTYYPSYWSDDYQLENTAFYEVHLKCKEAKEIASLVNEVVQVVRIERIQNKELYLRFLEYSVDNPGRQALLFHGTSDENYNLICNQGFDRGHSNNGLYGFGVYLSSCMKYSLDYAHKTEKKHRCMLICRTHITPDTKISQNIHVVHDDFAVYPEYLVYF